MTRPLTARATDHPCQLHRYHRPRPLRTHGHHRRPVYLQNRVWGRIRDTELLWVCGLCHDSIHEVIAWLLGEGREPSSRPGRAVLVEARTSVAWYLEAKAAAA